MAMTATHAKRAREPAHDLAQAVRLRIGRKHLRVGESGGPGPFGRTRRGGGRRLGGEQGGEGPRRETQARRGDVHCRRYGQSDCRLHVVSMRADDPSTGGTGWTFEQGAWKPYV